MSSFKGMRVCIPGGAGFLGSHLTDHLIALGATVYVLDNFSRGKNTNEKAIYIKGDAGDQQVCEWAFRGGMDGGLGEPVDTVFNLAATVAGVEHNMAHGYDMFLDNVRLQVAPVAAAEKLGVKTFLQVSSACIYDPDYNHPAQENYGNSGEPHHANYGYGWAKRMGEKMVSRSSIDNIIIVRPQNLYGPRDYFDDKAHVIPSLIRQYHEGKARLIGDGSAVREFLYVTDAAKALAHLVNVVPSWPLPYKPYNLGTNGETKVSIKWLHNYIAYIFGGAFLFDKVDNYNNPELARWSDCTRIESLGWKYDTGLEEGIKQTVEWYLEQQR